MVILKQAKSVFIHVDMNCGPNQKWKKNECKEKTV